MADVSIIVISLGLPVITGIIYTIHRIKSCNTLCCECEQVVESSPRRIARPKAYFATDSQLM